MIDFKEELKKYKPVLEAEAVDEEVKMNNPDDIVKVLQYLVKGANKTPVRSRDDYYSYDS
jgi:hypothetical protein